MVLNLIYGVVESITPCPNTDLYSVLIKLNDDSLVKANISNEIKTIYNVCIGSGATVCVCSWSDSVSVDFL